MTTYNTGNPVPSTAPKDLYDNAETIDEWVNSPALEVLTRLGLPTESLAGLKQMVVDYLAAQGFEAIHLQYVDGQPLTVLRPTQLIDRGASVYRIRMPSTFPVTLSGTWATDAPRLTDVGDEALRQSLAAATGAAMVGTSTGGTVETRLTAVDVLIAQIQEALTAVSASTVSYSGNSGLPGPTVAAALNALGRAGKDGLFSTPAALGHRAGQLAYALRADGNARLISDLTRFLPFGMEVDDDGISVPGRKAYYVSATGAVGADGLSWATALPSVATALAKTDVDIVFVRAGLYIDATHDGIAGQNMRTYAGNRNVAIVGVGGRVSMLSGAAQSSVAWVTTARPNVYAKDFPSGEYVAGMVALTHFDKFGLPLMLVGVDSLAAVEATPGSYRREGGRLYVRMPDNSVPDTQLVRTLGASTMFVSSPGTRVYLRNIDFIGGTSGSLVCSGGSESSVVASRNCRFSGAWGGNAYTVENIGLSILIDAVGGNATNDAFNYHAANGLAPSFIEINCVGVRGLAENTGNGSTAHETCSGFRINCNYAENRGPGVADVNDAKTYNVAVTSNSNGPSTSAAGFASQADNAVAGGCIVWLHRCSAAGNPGGDLLARVNGRMRVRDCQAITIATASGGTIESF